MEHQLFIFTSILAIVYAIFLCWCISGWLRLKKYESEGEKESHPVFISVIIPARNEEQHIHNCLSDFLLQDYPAASFELIVANDHSSDRTSEIVEKVIGDHPSHRIVLFNVSDGEAKGTFKKQAITEAISISSGELVITTDADCRRQGKWISTIAKYYHTNHPEMISAPVIFQNEKSWLEKIQSLEFLGLIGIGGAAIGNGMPFLCNGANLAFSKKIFIEAGGYAAIKNYSSGDDTQLMHKIAKRGKDRIRFLKSNEATVSTEAKSSVGELIDQRKRWASKIPIQRDVFTVFIAVIAYLLHACLILCAILVLFNGNVNGFLFLFCIKIIPEFILLFLVSVFFKKSKLLFLFLPAQVIYPLYISYVGIISLTGSYQWKGRQVT